MNAARRLSAVLLLAAIVTGCARFIGQTLLDASR